MKTTSDQIMENIAVYDALKREGFSEVVIDRIVRAVNSHEELLNALKQSFYLIKEGGFTHPMTEEFYDETRKKAREAIEKAEGK